MLLQLQKQVTRTLTTPQIQSQTNRGRAQTGGQEEREPQTSAPQVTRNQTGNRQQQIQQRVSSKLNRFQHLEKSVAIANIRARETHTAVDRSSAEALLAAEVELNKYIAHIKSDDFVALQDDEDVLTAWSQKASVMPILSKFARDVLALPCSEAFVERLFSTCGILTNARRNKMSANLEKRVFLKHNLHLL